MKQQDSEKIKLLKNLFEISEQRNNYFKKQLYKYENVNFFKRNIIINYRLIKT